MRDWILRIRVLAILMKDVWGQWWNDFVRRDLDEPYCCSGTWIEECGCGGATFRTIAEDVIVNDRLARKRRRAITERTV